MGRLAIDRDFLLDFVKLEKPVQSRVADVFTKFEQATHTGQHLEPVRNARDKRLHTIRIDLFWGWKILKKIEVN